MTRPLKTIVDCQTGESITVELTDEEIAQRQAMAQQTAAERAVIEAEAKAKEDARQSAIAKLAALGITEEEANALLG